MDVSWTTESGTLHTLTWVHPQSKPGAVQEVLYKREEVEQEKEEGQEKNSQREMNARCPLSCAGKSSQSRPRRNTFGKDLSPEKELCHHDSGESRAKGK